LLLGDFNFIRYQENRNNDGGDTNDMFLFNEIIGHLGLLELPLKGRKYTWSNMQDSHMLEQLDWFFTSTWISDYPNSMVLPLAKTSSDHVHCVVAIDTTILRPDYFYLKIIGWTCLVLKNVYYCFLGKGAAQNFLLRYYYN
jgi:hypothetical protein